MKAPPSGVINRDMMPGNDCFGCGLENPHSMGIQLRERSDGIEGLYSPFKAPAHALAFPNLVHPGAFFTALTCLSVWTPYRLRPEPKAVWFLTASQLNFHKAAQLGDEHLLRSRIVTEDGLWQPMRIGVEALDTVGDVLLSGEFSIHPFAPESAMQIAGVDTLPAAWAAFLQA